MENDTELDFLPWWFTDILSPLTTVMAEQNLESWFWGNSLPSPQVASLWIKANFPLYQQLPLRSIGYLFSFVYLGLLLVSICSVSLMESRYSFPFLLLPSVLSFRIVISQNVAFHKKRITGVKYRHRLYKAVVRAGSQTGGILTRLVSVWTNLAL